MADLQEAGLKLIAEGADAFESTLGSINGVLESFGGIVTQVAGAATEALVDFFSDSFAGALEAEQTIARLGQVIESTGGIAGLTVDEAEALADEFKHLAGGSDDAIISIIDMGLRMGTISEEEMPAFIQSTADLGAIMGDTGRAAQLMARAQEDPVGTLGALRKAGILFTEDQEAQIKAMVKAGDTAGAYALLMDGVGAATEGAAQALADTTAGQWTIFQETIADAGETIVGAFLPALSGILSGFMPLVPVVTDFANAIAAVIQAIVGGELGNIGEIFDILGEFESIQMLNDLLGISGTQFYAFGNVANDVVTWFQEVFIPGMQPVVDAVMNVVASFTNSLPMIQGTVQTMIDFVIGQFEILGPTLIDNVSTTLNEIATFWDNHGATIMAIVTLAFEVIATTIGVALNTVTGIITAALQLINGDWEGAWETYLDVLTSNLDAILSIVGMDLDEFLTIWTDVFTMLGTIIQFGFEQVVLFVSNGILSAIDAAMAIVDGVGAVGTAFIDNIIDGIASSISGLIEIATQAAQAAYDAILDTLGIHSPSPLLIAVGAQVDNSLALGLERNIGAVLEAASSVASAMVSPPMSASQIGAQYAYSNSYSVTNNLNVHTAKPLTTIAGEFATMQTLYGGAI